MTEQNTTQETGSEAQEAEQEAQATSTTQTTSEAASGDPGANGNDPWANLPEEYAWVKKEVSETRSEAERYRLRLRETEEKLAEADTTEKLEALKGQFAQERAELELELARERVLREHKSLNDDVLKVLDDVKDPEAFAARAEILANALGSREPEVKQTTPPERPYRAGRENFGEGDAPTDRSGADEWRKYRAKR